MFKADGKDLMGKKLDSQHDALLVRDFASIPQPQEWGWDLPCSKSDPRHPNYGKRVSSSRVASEPIPCLADRTPKRNKTTPHCFVQYPTAY